MSNKPILVNVSVHGLRKKKKGLEKENWSPDSNERKCKEVKSRQLNFHYKHWPVLISLTKPDIISPALHRTEQKFLLKAHHTSQHARVVAHLWGNSSPATLSHFALQQTCFWHFSFPTTPHYSHEERTNKGDHLFPQLYTPVALAETQCTPKAATTFFLSKTQQVIKNTSYTKHRKKMCMAPISSATGHFEHAPSHLHYTLSKDTRFKS